MDWADQPVLPGELAPGTGLHAVDFTRPPPASAAIGHATGTRMVSAGTGRAQVGTGAACGVGLHGERVRAGESG